MNYKQAKIADSGDKNLDGKKFLKEIPGEKAL